MLRRSGTNMGNWKRAQCIQVLTMSVCTVILQGLVHQILHKLEECCMLASLYSQQGGKPNHCRTPVDQLSLSGEDASALALWCLLLPQRHECCKSEQGKEHANGEGVVPCQGERGLASLRLQQNGSGHPQHSQSTVDQFWRRPGEAHEVGECWSSCHLGLLLGSPLSCTGNNVGCISPGGSLGWLPGCQEWLGERCLHHCGCHCLLLCCCRVAVDVLELQKRRGCFRCARMLSDNSRNWMLLNTPLTG